MMLDTNVVIDLTQAGGDEFSDASLDCLAQYVGRVEFYINHIVYAEVAPKVDDRAGFDQQLASLGIKVAPLDVNDAWRAGIAFREYRERGAPRSTILPDFLIGGQAANRGWAIMTRDAKRFASYFPELEVIDPTRKRA